MKLKRDIHNGDIDHTIEEDGDSNYIPLFFFFYYFRVRIYAPSSHIFLQRGFGDCLNSQPWMVRINISAYCNLSQSDVLDFPWKPADSTIYNIFQNLFFYKKVKIKTDLSS